MRLIDADALAKKCCIDIEEFGTCEKCLEHYASKGCDRICYLEYRGEDVQNAPTIDAIPVEWLEQQFYDNPNSQWAEKCRDVFTGWQKWQSMQKEQEAR